MNPMPNVVDGKMMYEAGTAVQLTANSYEGLVTFNNWSDGDTGSSKLISMTADTQLTAVYSQADIIAGWDFYLKGGEGRPADFASDGNETAALSLVYPDGKTSGWLDKSAEAAGGYESFKGAAVNWRNDVEIGSTWWQTKVNAENFTNIKVQFQMLYNYNAYQTYNAEYSLDGEEWTKFGSIAMTGAKVVASFNEVLPEACNNAENLFIRMIADKTSSVDGTASANDGNALAMFFITGTQALDNDGKAPKLVSTVPAGNATGVSASGKVVLTFDEKVKLAEGATAYINDTKINSETQIAVSGAVSGKSISFEYKGLEYTTEYSFVLPANSVSDLTDNTLESPVRLTFTTMTRPTVTKGLYDEVVDNVEQLVAAIGKAEARSDKNVRYRIFLKNGTYQLPQGTANVTHNVELKDGSSQQFVTKDVITYIKSGNISLIGESRDGVIITNTIPANETFEGKYGTASVYEGIGSSDVLQVSGSGLYFQDLTISTGMADGRGRDIALNDKGTQNVFKNVCLHGYQDTWKSGKGLYYFEGGVIRGRTDFLCGGGDAFFNQVDIVMCEKGGYVVAPQGNSHYGYVFKDCTLKGEAGDVSGNYNLGRAWTAEAETYFINTTMEALPNAKGWAEWNNGPKRFAEFNSKTATGTDVDLSSRAKTINGTPNVPVLTAEEAIEIGDLHNSFGDWDPTLATEQAPVPQNVKQEGNNLVWDNSNYALLWAIVKDGSVVGFTTEPTYELTKSGTYAVRAANEMGGLSEASESVVATVAEVVKVTLNASGYATLASAKALDFSGADAPKAYIVTATTDTKATLASVDAAPAETGLVLKGEAGAEYTIPVATSATSIEGNLLVAAVTATTVDAKSVYVLDGDKFKVFTGTKIPAGKAYLPKSGVGARLLELVFDDATGIATVPVDIPVDVPVYDLQGRRVKTPSKGVYVVEGKKVIIK
jgi:pectin methylesterase-like acyl-CoA thioesterase